VRTAADAVGVALRSDEDPHVVEWADKIRGVMAILERAQRGEPRRPTGQRISDDEIAALTPTYRPTR
jgi:hypothetical protein